jgi:hypothetical protein
MPQDIHIEYRETSRTHKLVSGKVTVHYADDCVVIMNRPPGRADEHVILSTEVFNDLIDEINRRG